MTDLDSLLRASAPEEDLPSGFVSNIMQMIRARDMHKQRKLLIRNGLVLSLVLILFFYASSLLLTDLIAAHTVDFFSLAIFNPIMLSMREGWLALLEAIPLASLVFAITTVIIGAFALRTFLHSIRTLSFFSYRYAH